MACDRQVLVVKEIQGTIQRLCLRIRDRFPDCDLAKVCERLYEVSQETCATVQRSGRGGFPISPSSPATQPYSLPVSST